MKNTVEKVLALREGHPNWTLIRIANEVGLTKARVWKILIDHKKPTSNANYRKTFSSFLCIDCGAVIRGVKTCPICNKRNGKYDTIACSNPGCDRVIVISSGKQKYWKKYFDLVHTYCSQNCLGAGRHLLLS